MLPMYLINRKYFSAQEKMLEDTKSAPRALFYERRGRDSNPGCLATHLISNQALSTTQPPLLNIGL